jgi:hypothetical protein
MRSHFVLTSLLGAGLALLISQPSPADDAPSKEKIAKLIEQLGSGSFDEREKATKELAAIGTPALEALRKAAKGGDLEIRKRVEEILPNIERQAESARVLAPKRVHLVYKDTPLDEAVADFQQKSGYTIALHDPDGKLKERKITLDTGEASFWHAFALFCEKAELTEASMEDQMRMPPAPGGAPPAVQPVLIRPGKVVVPGMAGMFGRNGQLILKDGKSKPLPTDDHSAARIRAVGKSDQGGNVPESEIILGLEISLEPKLQWQIFQAIHIDKAVDDQGQKLSQVIPQVEGAPGIAGNPAFAAPPRGGANMQMQMQMQMQMRRMSRQRMGWGGLSQQVPIQLKKGAKAAKSLKELQGVLTAQVLTEARPILTADNLDKAAGKTFKGDQGGSIKIVDVKAEENQTTVQLEFEQPPYDKVVPAQANVIPAGVRVGAPPGLRKPVLPAAPAAKPPQPPAVKLPVMQPAPLPLGRGAPGGLPRQLVDSFSGLVVQDDKGETLLLDTSRLNLSVSFVQQGNGPPKQTLTWTLVCPHDKERGKPAKIVYLGRKSVSVEVPFVLKDVPLP